ncbi:MAG: PD-(D/E)XK motif protein [Clostridia bacterium]|nr:PD-(D/E)XK motif protein [Clostridia bacterium]
MKTKELKTQMIEFSEIYNKFCDQQHGNQKKVPVDSCIEVFFGFSFEGNLRLSFMSKGDCPVMESTSILHVVQGREGKDSYWTSFDLLNGELKEAYFSFCENMIDSIVEIRDESLALNMLRRRFITWKKLFQKVSGGDISKEKLMGIFGELAVLKEIISKKYGVDTAIQAWGGPKMQSKDFTVGDTWYEVKTIGANADSIRISSLAQLSSPNNGHLVVVRAEAVSPEAGGTSLAIIDLVKEILLSVSSESIENDFIRKIQGMGIDVYGKEINSRFDIKSIKSYSVAEEFPRITVDNVPFPEITDVNYVLSVASIYRFIEE